MVKKIILCFTVVAFLVAAVAAFLNREKLELMYNSYFVSSEELQKKSEKSKNELKQTLSEDYGIENAEDVIDPKEEEALLDGSLSIDEVKERAEAQKIEREEQIKAAETVTKQEKCRLAVENAVNEIYVLRAEYLVELSGVEKEIIRYYNDLMSQEGMTKIRAKLSVANNYAQTMVRFQKKCDDAVNAVLAELETTLKENDGDLGIISQIESEYKNVKNEKLSYYMSRYNKK